MEDVRTHLSQEDIVRYRDRLMSPDDLVAADRHIAGCDLCHGRVINWAGFGDRVASALTAFEGMGTSEITHLSYDELAGLVDDKVGEIDREIFETHLADCEPCRNELSDLRAVRDSITAQPTVRTTPAQTRQSLRETLSAFWRTPAFGVAALAGLAAIALVSFLISIPLRRENAEVRAKLAELEANNARLQEKLSVIDALQAELIEARQENDRLRKLTGDQSLIAVNDGGSRVTLDETGNLSGIEIPSRYEQSVKDALRTQRVKLPAELRNLRVSSGTLMGEADHPEFKLLSPVGVVIESDHPTFKWSALDGASSYTVAIFDESFNKVATSETLSSPEFVLKNPLTRGKTYIWQVRALKGGEEVVAPAASKSKVKFRVLEQSKLDELSRAKQTYANSHLTLGVIYAEAGLLKEAEREFAELVKTNPDSTVARKLLQSVTLR